MPQDDPEAISRQIQSLAKHVTEFTGSVSQLGTERDNGAPLREKLRKIRATVSQLDSKIDEMLKQSPGDDQTYDQLKSKFQKLRKDFETVNTKAKRLENQRGNPALPQQEGQQSPRSSGGAGSSQIRIQDIKQVDMSEMATEEALQREKLHGALEIESEMRDLKSTYQEFQDLVVHQQTGLDTTSKNITESKQHVEKGVVELKQASQYQQSSRKKMCIIVVILVVVLGAIIGILFISKAM